jgi:hypothetical protein
MKFSEVVEGDEEDELCAQALVDSGATYSFARQSTLSEWLGQEKWRELVTTFDSAPYMRLVSPAGVVRPIGCVTLELSSDYAGPMNAQQFWVLPDLPCAFTLGRDFLNSRGASMDFENNLLQIPSMTAVLPLTTTPPPTPLLL